MDCQVVCGKVTEVKADAIVTLIHPLEEGEKKQDEVALDIWRIAGDYYEEQALDKLADAKDGEVIVVEGSEVSHDGPFKDVFYIKDGGEHSLTELVYDALVVARERGCQSLALPVLWRGVDTLKEIADKMCTGVRRFRAEHQDHKMRIIFAVGSNPAARMWLNEYNHR